MDRITKIAILFLLVAVASKICHGQELNLVSVNGYRAVSPSEVRTIYEKAGYYFSQVGLNFRVRYVDYNLNPCIHLHNWINEISELECFKQDASNNGYRRRKMITYYMLAPWIVVDEEGGSQSAWIGGIAEDICGQVAIGNATDISLSYGVEGDSRIDHSTTILAHEVLHLMCATHQSNKPNLMHPSANQYTTEYHGRLPVLRITKRQVKRGLVKQRRKL